MTEFNNGPEAIEALKALIEKKKKNIFNEVDAVRKILQAETRSNESYAIDLKTKPDGKGVMYITLVIASESGQQGSTAVEVTGDEMVDGIKGLIKIMEAYKFMRDSVLMIDRITRERSC